MSEIEQALAEFIKARDRVKSLAKMQFTVEACPLRHNHYELSEELFGQGCWSWDCEFCGKNEQE